MLNLLEQATAATQQGNWSSVNQYLQQLLLYPSHPPLSLKSNDDLQHALDLALVVLANGDFQARWDVTKMFPKFGSLAIDPLIEIVEDEDADLEQRWFAGRTLGAFPTPKVIMTLVNLLHSSEDEELAAIAASALTHVGQPAIDALTDVLADPNSRYLAVRALTQIHQPAVISPLLSVVDDPDARVRTLAIETLSSFHDDRIPPVLIAALKDYVALVRKEAAIGLGLRADLATELDLLAHLHPLLYDLNLEVAQQAAIALGRLGTEAAAVELSKVLQSPATPLPLQITVIQSLAWMETDFALHHLEQAIELSAENTLPEKAFTELIHVMGRIETDALKEKTAQMLLHVFESGHPLLAVISIRQALAHALGQLGEGEATAVLQQLEADENASVQFHAIAALKRLHCPD